MLTDFRNFSIVEFTKKFATNRLSHCPPHLRRVATLPCEMTTVISQGSVATRLRCGEECDRQLVANFLTNSTMEKFRKSVNVCQSYGQKYGGPFLTHSVETLVCAG